MGHFTLRSFTTALGGLSAGIVLLASSAALATPAGAARSTPPAAGLPPRNSMPGTWIAQTAQTSRFSFNVACTIFDPDAGPEVSGAGTSGVEVIDRRTGLPHQRMPIEGIGRLACEDFAQVDDWNFDGYPDLVLYSHDGGAGPNTGYDFFLFNPRLDRFVHDAELSEQTQPTLDKARREVRFAERNGAASYAHFVYRVDHGTFRLVESTFVRYVTADSDFIETVKKTWVRGHWVQTRTRKKP